MDYTELIVFEKAFDLFLRKQKNKEEIEVKYYLLIRKNKPYDLSFIGYLEEKGGRHGLHYNKNLDTYYFGTRNIKLGKRPEPLNPAQITKIPSRMKQAFFDVTEAKKDRKIKRET
jgi:hypothetical protein